MVRSFMPRLRAIPRIIGHERYGASSRVEFGFRNEFCARAISPVAEKNSRKRSFALRNDQIRSDRPALRTRVGYIVKSSSVELLDYLFMDIQRRLCVIIEKVRCGLVVRCGPGRVLGSTYKRFDDDLCRLSDGRLSVVYKRS